MTEQDRHGASADRFELAMAGSRLVLWDMDVRSGELFLSRQIEQLLGYTAAEFGAHRSDFIRRLHPQERSDVLERLNALIDSGIPFEAEMRVQAKDASYRWLRASGRSLPDDTGRPARVVGSLADIDERKRLEAQLLDLLYSRQAALEALRAVLRAGMTAEPPVPIGPDAALPVEDALQTVSSLVAQLLARHQQNAEHLDAIFGLSPDGFVSFDRQQRVNHVNAAFGRLTGHGPDEVMGLHEDAFVALLSRQLAPGSRLPSLRSLGAQNPGSEPHRRGTERPTQLELQAPARRVIEIQLHEAGPESAISQVMYLRDVTRESEVERMKSEFLSTAAHELRTPMASIMGFAELLLGRSYSQERRDDMLQTMRRQAQRMVTIINDLLDLARIEARQGKEFDLHIHDLRTLAQEAVRDMGLPEGRDAPRLELGDEPALVRVDHGKLMQALGNVLSNAYKYSRPGDGVGVSVVFRASSAAGTGRGGLPQCGLRVSDQGIGMSPEHLARLGERFFRADASGNIPGTGLGVAIVREIIELHGGSMDVQSEQGKGTQVTLWLPREDNTP